MRLLAIVFMMCMAEPCVPAQPDSPAHNWGVEALMQKLAQVDHSQARFVERKYLKVLKAPLEQSGTLSYTRPDRLEKRTLKPHLEILSVAGEKLVLENPSRKVRRELKLRDYPALWGFVESIRSTLGGDIKSLERFYRLELEGKPSDWRLFLVPLDRKMNEVISLVRIDGSDARINTIEVQETGGDRSVMKIYEDSR